MDSLYTAEIDSAPRSVAASGTISSGTNAVVINGSGSAFTTEAELGDFIYVPSQGEFSKITMIVDDEKLQVEKAFDTPLAGASYALVKRRDLSKETSWKVLTGTAVINGIPYAASTSLTLSKASQTGSYTGKDRIRPVHIDTSSGSTVAVSLIH